MKGKEGRGAHPVHSALAAAAVLLLSVLPAACGYRFNDEPTTFGPGLRTVFVDVFANRTGEPYAANIFRSAFIDRFVQEGRFSLAASRGEADLILRGSVRSVQTIPLAYQAGNVAAENRLAVTLELNLDERVTGRTLWSNASFTGTEDYAVASVNLSETSRKDALTKLASDAAERAYRLIMSGF